MEMETSSSATEPPKTALLMESPLQLPAATAADDYHDDEPVPPAPRPPNVTCSPERDLSQTKAFLRSVTLAPSSSTFPPPPLPPSRQIVYPPWVL